MQFQIFTLLLTMFAFMTSVLGAPTPLDVDEGLESLDVRDETIEKRYAGGKSNPNFKYHLFTSSDVFEYAPSSISNVHILMRVLIYQLLQMLHGIIPALV